MRSNKELIIKRKKRNIEQIDMLPKNIQIECETSQKFDVRVNRYYGNIKVHANVFI